MNTYEMLYILDNDISDDAKSAIQSRFEGIIESFDGKVVSVDVWGAKKLSYPIKFKSEGYYVVMTYEAGKNGSVEELNRVCGISSEVLRVQITKKI